MPGGICAKERGDFQAAVRCGALQIRCLGIRRQVALGGVAEAYFPDRDQAGMDRLRPRDTVRVVWEKAVFHGADSFLGRITARLLPARTGEMPASLISSLSQVPGGSFFPAISRNYLMFQITVPRFNLVFESKEPVVNSARIDKLPPYGAVYSLEGQVRFQAVAGSGWWRHLLKTITIEKCEIKLVELQNIRIRIEVINQSREVVTFRLNFLNETSESNIGVAWLVWPEPVSSAGTSGVIDLARDEKSIVAEMNRDIFASPRWLAVSITEPFATDAAMVARFP